MKIQLKLLGIFLTLSVSALAYAQVVKGDGIVTGIKTTSTSAYFVKCVANGTSALQDGSDNFNIAEFNGEFTDGKVSYYNLRSETHVDREEVAVENIEEIKPIGSEGCFLFKYKK